MRQGNQRGEAGGETEQEEREPFRHDRPHANRPQHRPSTTTRNHRGGGEQDHAAAEKCGRCLEQAHPGLRGGDQGPVGGVCQGNQRGDAGGETEQEERELFSHDRPQRRPRPTAADTAEPPEGIGVQHQQDHRQANGHGLREQG